MAEWLTRAFEVAKSPRLAALVCAISSVLVFAPQDWLTKLRMADFSEKYGLYFGIVWLGSASALLVNIVIGAWQWIRSKSEERVIVKIVRAHLQTLDRHEKALLREFSLKQRNTLNLPIQEPVVSGLLAEHILVTVPGMGDNYVTTGMLKPMCVSKIAMSYLMSDMIDLPTVPEGWSC